MILLLLLLSSLLLAACTANDADMPAPAGAAKGQNTFLLFFTDNWAPWAEMQPIVYGLEAEYGEELAFDRLNATTEPGRTLLRTYGLRGHPSYAIVDPEGKSLWSATGLLAEDLLRTEIRQSLQ